MRGERLHHPADSTFELLWSLPCVLFFVPTPTRHGMPTTYNGVGTHYYGKRNMEVRRADCRSCGRHGNLASYDTRLWFVVVFIPVIPLGRKRIIEDCPACRRHYVVDADKWETQKQLGISGAMEAYTANPTPEAAMELHQTMLNFQQSTQAAEFRRGMLEKFGDNAHIHAYLGQALSLAGHETESGSHFARALELRPDLPAARVGVALRRIADRKLDEARALLDFLEKPGAEHLYSLEPLEILADAYRGAGQHAQARELYQRLLTALPAIGQIPAFRIKVQASEKALRPATSVLPKREWSWKNLFGGKVARMTGLAGIILLLIGVGVLISNEYCRRNRQLYLVNATDSETTVILRGQGTEQTFRLAGKPGGQKDARPSVEQVKLTEGHYRVQIRGAKPDEFDLEMHTDYWDRWSDPSWLINVDGAALLISERAIYRANPPPPTFEFHFGRTQEALSKITHPFKELPQTLEVKSGEERTLTRIDFFPGDALGAIGPLIQMHRDGEALNLAEWMLRRNLTNELLVQTYVGLATQQRQLPRARKVLKEGLGTRPVNIGWHRMYQNLHLNRTDEAALTAEYDQLLAADPENSALIYLRGRIEAKGEPWFERALKSDPKNAYASFALGYDRFAAGEFAAARPLLVSAVEGVPDSEQFKDLLWQCRFALGETESLETEAREEIKRDPVLAASSERLINLLAAREDKAAVAQVVADYARAVGRFDAGQRGTASAMVRHHALYATGDFSAMEKDAVRDLTPGGRRALLTALLEQDRVSEAVKVRGLKAVTDDDDWHCLVVSLAFRQVGDMAAADAWQERGLQFLEAGHRSEQECARLLRAETPPTVAEVAALKTDVMTKAIVLTSLAARHPAQRAEFHKLVGQLPLARTYPYHFLRRLTAAEK
jgi:tetratricopeptide (TPR) repeat protein